MSTLLFTKREIIEQFFMKPGIDDRISVVVNYILSKLGMHISNIKDNELRQLRAYVSALNSKHKEKWNGVKRTKTKYESKHKKWLDSVFTIPKISIKKNGFFHSCWSAIYSISREV